MSQRRIGQFFHKVNTSDKVDKELEDIEEDNRKKIKEMIKSKEQKEARKDPKEKEGNVIKSELKRGRERSDVKDENKLDKEAENKDDKKQSESLSHDTPIKSPSVQFTKDEKEIKREVGNIKKESDIKPKDLISPSKTQVKKASVTKQSDRGKGRPKKNQINEVCEVTEQEDKDVKEDGSEVILEDSKNEAKAESNGKNKTNKKLHPFFAPKATGKKVKTEHKGTISNIDDKGSSLEAHKDKEAEIEAAHKLANLEVPKIKKEDFKNESSYEMEYKKLCEMFSNVEATTKRLEKIEILTEFFVNVLSHWTNNKGDLPVIVICIYLCINRIAPEYDGLELGVGEHVLIKAVSEATGRTIAKVKEDVVKSGDLGIVAEESRSNQRTLFKPKELGLKVVFNTLKEIASFTGNSSMQKKVDKIKKMLVTCRGNEAKFLIRSLEGKLRIGLAEKTVLVSLAQASVLYRNADKKISKDKMTQELIDAAEAVKTAYSELPNYELIVTALIIYGHNELFNHCKLAPGIPIKPMLAHPTKALTDVLNRFSGVDFICEYKYDGERAQIHLLPSGEINVYSRNSENMTQKYPDIVTKVADFKKETISSFVLDCEAVAWDKEEKKLLPFQVLSTRKRKDVKEEDIKVKVVIFAFDLLYLNGESLLRTPLLERKRLLRESFNQIDGVFTYAKDMTSNQVDEIQTFLDESIADQCEGLMVKVLNGKESSYEPSKRSRNWLKVKKDYLEGIGDSVDLVVIGAYIGKGKRTGVYGGYLLACYDLDSEEYQSVCKIGTGFSEQDLASQFEELKEFVIEGPQSDYNFGAETKPDVWFKSALVWEVKAADLSISPVYKAGLGKCHPSKGISLRFPRFIRKRDDKKAESATNSEQIADMYKLQQETSNQSNSKDKFNFADDDFEY